MKLYNCYSEGEKILKKIELAELSNKELVELAQTVKEGWDVGTFEDEEIVISALVQIAEELGRRCE